MGLREKALSRIVAMDARRSAELALQTAVDDLGASAAALLVIEGARYKIWVAATELGDDDLRLISATWDRSRSRLLAGERVVDQDWALAPICGSSLLYLRRSGRPL
jgi:hypothetical protein